MSRIAAAVRLARSGLPTPHDRADASVYVAGVRLGIDRAAMSEALGVSVDDLDELVSERQTHGRWIEDAVAAMSAALDREPEPVYFVWADFDALPGREWGRL